MIKLYFYDYGCKGLNVEKELGITEDIDDLLTKMIPGLRFEACDSLCDLDDNEILWFSADDEEECIRRIHEILKEHLPESSRLRYTAEINKQEG